MQKKIIGALVVPCLLGSVSVHAASFADSVIQYHAGTGASTGYQNPESALGEPSRTAPAGPSDAEVNPFNPAWTKSQLVSIGKGGDITLHASSSVTDSASNPYGVDFILFGNNGFQVTDYSVPADQYTTDGSLFTFDTPGASKVFVSENNVDFYELVPPVGVSAQVDGLFPSDAHGSFDVAMNPGLKSADFAGKTLDGLRQLYAGSAGGTGFDLAWARAQNGSPVKISRADYIRIEVLDGKVEIDGLAVVPEPRILALAGVSFCGLLWRRRTRMTS